MTGDNIMGQTMHKDITGKVLVYGKMTISNGEINVPGQFKLKCSDVVKFGSNNSWHTENKPKNNKTDRMLMGGALFGGIGAVLGGASNGKADRVRIQDDMSVTIYDKNGSTYYVDFFDLYHASRQITVDSVKKMGMYDSFGYFKQRLNDMIEVNKKNAEKTVQQPVEKPKHEIDEDEYQEFLEFMEWKKMKGKK